MEDGYKRMYEYYSYIRRRVLPGAVFVTSSPPVPLLFLLLFEEEGNERNQKQKFRNHPLCIPPICVSYLMVVSAAWWRIWLRVLVHDVGTVSCGRWRGCGVEEDSKAHAFVPML